MNEQSNEYATRTTKSISRRMGLRPCILNKMYGKTATNQVIGEKSPFRVICCLMFNRTCLSAC